MGFTIIKRLNLVANPTNQPGFPSKDNLIYRISNTTIRKAVMGPDTDVILSAALTNAIGRNAITEQNYYIVWRGNTLHLVNVDTGVLTTSVQNPYSDGAVGILVRNTGVRHICTLGGDPFSPTVGYQSYTPFPPLGVTEEIMGGLNTAHNLMSIETFNAPVDYTLLGWRNNPYKNLRYRPIPNFDNSPITRPLIFEGENLIYTWTNTYIPWFIRNWNIYAYEFWYKAISLTPGMNRYDRTTGTVSSINLSAIAKTGTPNFSNSYAIHQPTGRIYFSIEDRFRLYGASLSQWPISLATADTIEVDAFAGNNCLTGIAVFPPYVYVCKEGGATYGPQFIKIYDSKLAKNRKIYLGTRPRIRY